MPILTQSQLQQLKQHKYASEGRTCTDFLLQPWWNAVVSKVPLWIAPNLITLTGLLINITTSVSVILCSMQAKSNDIPPIYFFCTAIGLFIYQTLDAIDGKQARRTGTSSPLGELFDHGCDSVSNLVLSLCSACAISLGSFPNFLFFSFVNNIAVFYVAHWQTYCSGRLIFGKYDVTELQLQAIAMFVVVGFLTPSFFLQEVSFLPYHLAISKCIVIALGFSTLCYCCKAFNRILRGGVGKNGTTVAQTSVLSPIVPLGIVMTCAFYVFKHNSELLFIQHPILFMMMFGTAASKLTCNLIVASMSKSALDMLDMCMIGPIFLAMYIYFGVGGLLQMVNVNVPEHHILALALVFTAINFLSYCVCLCKEISEDFGIAVLTIPYPKEEKKK